jgi:hypothetical protein
MPRIRQKPHPRFQLNSVIHYCTLVFVASISMQAQAQQTIAPISNPSAQAKNSFPQDAGEKIDQLLTRLVLENIPHKFEDSKDWGRQVERWDGVKFRREGLKIKTNRRKKLVNDGTWTRYSVQLRDPKEKFSIQIKNMRESKENKFTLEVHFISELSLEVRHSKWLRGVQLFSVSAEGFASLRLVVSVDLEIKPVSLKLPPDFVVSPVVKKADIVLDEFRIDRVGKVGGEVSQQITKAIRSELEEKIEQKEPKLVLRMNQEIDKNRDDLRISIADSIQAKWFTTAQEFLSQANRKPPTD